MAGEVIYFVSDLHLGDGTGADRFRYPGPFLELLKRIEAEPNAQLVLLGDIMELWASNLEGVLIAHAPIFAALGRLAMTHRVTYVVGNHDALPWYYFVGQAAGKLNVVERLTAAGGKLVALHGHQFDPFNQIEVTNQGEVKAPWVRRLVQAIGFLGRVGGPKTGDAIADVTTWLADTAGQLETLLPEWDDASRQRAAEMLVQTKAILERESPGERQYPQDVELYNRAARELMRDGAQYVVMGHTHHPIRQTYGPRTYVNTGSWVWDRYPPTYARFDGRNLQLLNAETNLPYEPPVEAHEKTPDPIA